MAVPPLQTESLIKNQGSVIDENFFSILVRRGETEASVAKLVPDGCSWWWQRAAVLRWREIPDSVRLH